MRFLLLSVLALTACTSIVPLTAMRLSGLSPASADPADLAIDLGLPAGIDVSPGGATMIFKVSRVDLGETREGQFALKRDGSIFMVDPQDYADLRALQALTRTWQAENDDATNGSLMINVSPCRIGDGPAEDARVNVAVRMQRDGAFLPLVRDGPLSAVTSEQQLQDMPNCP
ncbi:hypothetical protein BC777_1941 [Yoonia maricola]|uniref:Lipoprotein n=1 Tax=Yoonia maricola TaxID=420999 RepID=A0A2M8WQ64_9RHOB|nr:hypothetical protein [Yoonia maricola]PJI93073.1 hypothetical protein BC777_1941 [Yoonia maricola]